MNVSPEYRGLFRCSLLFSISYSYLYITFLDSEYRKHKNREHGNIFNPMVSGTS